MPLWCISSSMSSWRPLPMLAFPLVCNPYVKFPPCYRTPWSLNDVIFLLVSGHILPSQTLQPPSEIKGVSIIIPCYKWGNGGLEGLILLLHGSVLRFFSHLALSLHYLVILPFLRIYDLSWHLNLLKSRWLVCFFYSPPVSWTGKELGKY